MSNFLGSKAPALANAQSIPLVHRSRIHTKCQVWHNAFLSGILYIAYGINIARRSYCLYICWEFWMLKDHTNFTAAETCQGDHWHFSRMVVPVLLTARSYHPWLDLHGRHSLDAVYTQDYIPKVLCCLFPTAIIASPMSLNTANVALSLQIGPCLVILTTMAHDRDEIPSPLRQQLRW